MTRRRRKYKAEPPMLRAMSSTAPPTMAQMGTDELLGEIGAPGGTVDPYSDSGACARRI